MSLRVISTLVIAWLLVLGISSSYGFFSDFSALPPRLSFALLIPLIGVLLFVRSRPGKQLLVSIRPEWLIYLQSFRIFVEVGLWLLVRNGLLPTQVSFEGRNFDVLVGLLAFPVGYYVFVKRSWSPLIAVVYNVFGLVSLLNVVVIATLSMPTPLRVFVNQPDTSLLTKFPLIYLPGLLVPVAYTLHIFSLRQWKTYPAAIKS